jgi:dTDP-4-dehydrorhamnose reductase
VPGALAACCRRLGLPFVHVSTDYVFDGAKSTPYLEHDDVAPLQVYGQSKLDGERFVLERHPDALIVRTSTLFGAGRVARPHYVSAILRQAREGRRIEVVKPPIASPTYSIDLANAIVDLLRCGASGIVHGSNRGGCSRLDLAREIVRLAAGTGVRRVEVHERSAVAGPPARPAYSVLDTTKFSELTGREMPSWQDGLARYLASPSGGNAADESSAR